MSRPQRIPTGRTWRDLPPSPPSTFVPAPVIPDDPVAVQRPRVKVWPFVLGGVAVVVLGFIVGLMLPRSDGPEDSSLAPAATTLPDVIVPPAPTTLPPDSEAPLTIPDLEAAPDVERLFEVPSPPDGFRKTDDLTQATSERIDQTVVLTDGVTEVSIWAWVSAAEPTLPIGEPITVRGQEGVVTRGEEGRYLLSWIEPGKVSFEIDAPEGFDVTEVLLLAESLEMR